MVAGHLRGAVVVLGLGAEITIGVIGVEESLREQGLLVGAGGVPVQAPFVVVGYCQAMVRRVHGPQPAGIAPCG